MQGSATLDGDDLGRYVYRLTGVLAGFVALVCGLVWGPAEAVGALAGSAIMLADFAGLRFIVVRVVRTAGRTEPGEGRAGLWIGASGVRLGLVALGLGVVITRGGVGLRGLLLSLMVLPLTLVVAGLRGARTA